MKAMIRPYALCCAAAVLLGCGGINSPSNNVNETFSGTVAPETGSTSPVITHLFTVNRTGEMSARVTSITPNNAALIGLGFGEQISGACRTFTLNNLSGLNRDVMVTPVLQRGNFCLQVFNGGGVSSPQNYTVQVNHP
ncbi:MAG: hypothetical protein FJW27_12055 [Acidimicrobiia bacterium]|nr:hypothetical protein [Acidimicrobiia bacterium]